MKFGLTKDELKLVQDILASEPAVKKVVVYGSKATGTYKPTSDIDLCIMNPVDLATVNRLKTRFEEARLAYFVDLTIFEKTRTQNFVSLF